MDAEAAEPEYDLGPHELDLVPVSELSSEIKDLIVFHIDTIVHSNENIPASLIQPILRHIKRECVSPATLFALLASRLHFKNESNTDPGSAKLWRTRWKVCEELCLRLIPSINSSDLAQYLVFEFYPLADGTSATTLPTWLRVSALELAIKSEAKRLLAHPVIVQIVSALYDGHLVLDPHVHKLHRSNQILTKLDLWQLTNARKGVVVTYDFESTTIFKPSRLRVPKYRDWLKFFNLGVMILLYVSTMDTSTSPWTEHAFQIWLFSFILDEIQMLNAVGVHLYFLTLWSLCDFATVVLGGVYLLLQLWACISDTPTVWRTAGYDVLAICGVTLIPRVFSVLEASVGFSRTVISVRKMVAELLWCWVAITMFSVGFWAALAHFGKGLFSGTKIFYDLVQIMFGFTPAVWQTWHQYPAPGAMILFLYLFMAQFVVTTIVTAALSAKVVETKDNSLEEYHFLNAVKAEVRIKSERQVLYFYSQPSNILCFFPLPILRSILPTPWYLKVQRLTLKITHWHVFMVIYAYERLTNALVTRREKFVHGKQQRFAQQVQGHLLKRKGPLRLGNRKADQLAEVVSMGSLRDTKFDLVEEALNSGQDPPEQHASSSRAPAQASPGNINNSSWTLRPNKRHWSFSSERGTPSMMSTNEEFTDLYEVVRDLQMSNTRLEEMLKKVLHQTS